MHFTAEARQPGPGGTAYSVFPGLLGELKDWTLREKVEGNESLGEGQKSVGRENGGK